MSSKRAGPSLSMALPELVECPDCKGELGGVGLLHWMPCSTCDGLGKIEAATEQALPVYVGYPNLVTRIRKLHASNKQLRAQVKALLSMIPEEKLIDPYAGSGKYKGD